MAFNTQSLILASTSKTRQTMLAAANLAFESVRPEIDERALQQNSHHHAASNLSLVLARAKASAIYRKGQLIIGADQTLECEGRLIHKAENLAQARANLINLGGKTHYLHSAVSVMKNAVEVFQHVATAAMTMRNLSEAFLDAYCHEQEEALLCSVGGYYFEGAGVHLFEAVEGDIHTILGFPMLPLLAFLREEGIIPS